MHIIDKLAAFAAEHPRGQLPADVKERIRLLVLDLVAATGAGFTSDLAKAARYTAIHAYGGSAATLWLSGEKSSVAGAAQANSAAASALDIDDGHRGAAGHAGAGVIPAALAVAEALGSADEDIYDAIALGYDIALRIATSRPAAAIDSYNSGRWVGYGAAAAAGRLLKLCAPAMAHAMAIAGAEGPIGYPSGTSRYQGTTVKEMIPPAVVAGITAAYRAAAGATGPRDLLDNAEKYDPAILLSDHGEQWWLTQCYLKPYACCRYMHAAVDAILALRKPELPVLSLKIETFPQGLRLSNERAPQTLEGGQYSFYFSCALAALKGEAALQPVNPDTLTDHDILALAERITLEGTPDFASAFPKSTPARVSLDQGQGIEIMEVLHPRGDVANPLGYTDIVTKFRRITATCITPDDQQSLLQAFADFPQAGFTPVHAALSRQIIK
ncbi:MmgE/PrpD family protein (plasmid) [Pseudochrobactrum algeriensis]|uniref:MmgE/PrpD family protein n=1 Tax=Pseudochrobactrum algeriensis TaxID=2834768 RepID=UPI001BCCE144|nr:MmgE/PrpD family protein [Pseudochrobactrum algeriensis]MBX8812535.1 MmgE/PrpD family protein [Ochrobactrum sp. MR34]QVQ35236.1 MmgE/PrpD family protein [Pseudochrobactrum algeriensis]QVQ41852.1 MmgE/PrpD family protein [Pseudochrobactrum algeriensis]QVQ42466.1 MmgE/PrpD family protein [Pseudochrobactrum algeriensis]